MQEFTDYYDRNQYTVTAKEVGLRATIKRDGTLWKAITAGTGAANWERADKRKGRRDISPSMCARVDTGAPLAVFADGASDVPGIQVTDSESETVRWNNHAAPKAISVNISFGDELDDADDVTFHAIVSKTGATLADATTLAIGAFFHPVGALHDADANAGGATGAVVGDLTAKTTTKLSRTIAAADVPAGPVGLFLSIGPTAGTLGTDDFLIHEMWVEYTAISVPVE